MILLISLSFISMSLFCLAMKKHRKKLITQKLSPKVCRLFKPLAWLLLVFTLYISIGLYGWSIGPAVFIGALSGSLLPLILLLTYRAKMVPWLAFYLTIFSAVNLVV